MRVSSSVFQPPWMWPFRGWSIRSVGNSSRRSTIKPLFKILSWSPGRVSKFRRLRGGDWLCSSFRASQKSMRQNGPSHSLRLSSQVRISGAMNWLNLQVNQIKKYICFDLCKKLFDSFVCVIFQSVTRCTHHCVRIATES